MRAFTAIIFLIVLTGATSSAFAQTAAPPKTMPPEEVRTFVEKAKEKRHWLLVKIQGKHGKFEVKGRVTEIRDKDFLLEDTCLSCWEGVYVKFEQVHSIKKRSNLRRLLRDVPAKTGFYSIMYPIGFLVRYIDSFRE